jgi:hypothetical protein
VGYAVNDWRWKLREAVESLQTRYEHIGRKTGAPFLAVVYPPDQETSVLREWRHQRASLAPEFDVRTVDALAVTQAALADLGVDNVVEALHTPMPGSDPATELGHLWVNAVSRQVREKFDAPAGRPIVVVEGVSSLFPVAGPRDVMQQLWDSTQAALAGPVVILLPGTVLGSRTYSFLNLRHEFMYRGDLL